MSASWVLPLVVLVAISYVNSVSATQDSLFLGDPIDIQDAPFVATIFNVNKVQGVGSIISPRHILTGKFVVHYIINYQVRVGSNSSTEGGQVYNVTKKFLQPDYKDMVILELDSDIEFSESVQPIKFAGSDDPEIEDGAMMTVYAFGQFDNLLRALDQPKLNQEECRQSFRLPVRLAETVICAGSLTVEQASMFLSGGAPLIHNGVQVGEVQLLGNPTNSQRVSVAADWIQSVIQPQ